MDVCAGVWVHVCVCGCMHVSAHVWGCTHVSACVFVHWPCRHCPLTLPPLGPLALQALPLQTWRSYARPATRTASTA